MKKNKIVYILEDGRFGGMNKMTADLAVELKKYGFEPEVLVGRANSDFFLKKLENEHITFQSIKLSVLSKNIASLVRYTFTFFPDIIKLMQRIRQADAKLVYCNGSQQIKGAIAATLLNKIVVWHIHDTYQPRLLLTLFNFVRKVCKVKHYVASSERTIEFYGLKKEETHVSHPPVNVKKFKPVKCSFDNSRELVITTVCNINIDKGLETLVKTAALLNESQNNVTFKIVGLLPQTQKRYFQSILNLAEDFNVKNIQFLGQRDDIYKQLADSTLYLCTSNNESGPIAVFEAMSMGIPVVTTDVGDLKIIFEQYDCGKVHSVGDSTSLSKEILSIINNPKKQQKLSQNVQTAVLQCLDITICARKQSEFLTSVLTKYHTTN